MAVNLVGQLGRAQSRQLLESSFAQFQADRSVAGLATQIRRSEASLAELSAQMQCGEGDFAEFAQLRARLSAREAELSRTGVNTRRAAVLASMDALRVGDVICVPSGRRAGLAIVLDPGVHPRDEPHPLLLTEGRWAGRLSPADFPSVVEVLTKVRVPKHFNHRSPQDRRDLASTLRAVEHPKAARPRRLTSSMEDSEVLALRAAIRAHPCHRCPDRDLHARWAERFARLDRETDAVRRRMEGKLGSLGRRFERICQLLDDRGYLDADQATDAGRQLSRIWSESDLVVSECLRARVWDGLDAAELAAVVSTLVYEARREERLGDRLPTGAVRDALAATSRVWAELAADEATLGLPSSREPELGFVWVAYRWARADSLDNVLAAATQAGVPMPAGDFVRWCKQLLDLLEQIASMPTADPSSVAVAANARTALGLIRRGVVAQSMQL